MENEMQEINHDPNLSDMKILDFNSCAFEPMHRSFLLALSP